MVDNFENHDNNWKKETDSEITQKPREFQKEQTILTSARIREDYWNLCKDAKIPFSKALEYGIQIMSADLHWIDYEDARFPEIPLYRNMKKYQKLTEDWARKCEVLEDENKILKEQLQERNEKE